MSAVCIIENCGNRIRPGSSFKTCGNCRASMGMWQRRGVAATLQRRATLAKYDTRMSFVADRDAHPKADIVDIVPKMRKPKKGGKK